VSHVRGKIDGQGTVDDDRRNTAVEPGGDGRGKPPYVPLGEGEAVVGASQAGEQDDGLLMASVMRGYVFWRALRCGPLLGNHRWPAGF
jgi:hypothetical protein